VIGSRIPDTLIGDGVLRVVTHGPQYAQGGLSSVRDDQASSTNVVRLSAQVPVLGLPRSSGS